MAHIEEQREFMPNLRRKVTLLPLWEFRKPSTMIWISLIDRSVREFRWWKLFWRPLCISYHCNLWIVISGFTTAVEEAGKAIRTAATEAECQPRTIGLVKLMGRNSGFIAAHSTMASGNVDLCLIPEVPIHLDGPHSIFNHLEEKLKQHKHAVIVVAEGAGQEVLPW